MALSAQQELQTAPLYKIINVFVLY